MSACRQRRRERLLRAAPREPVGSVKCAVDCYVCDIALDQVYFDLALATTLKADGARYARAWVLGFA